MVLFLCWDGAQWLCARIAGTRSYIPVPAFFILRNFFPTQPILKSRTCNSYIILHVFECPPEDLGLRTVYKYKKAALLQCLSDSFKIKQVIYLIKTARLSSNLHASSVSRCGWFPKSLDTYWAPDLLGIPHTEVFGNEHWESECVHTVQTQTTYSRLPSLKKLIMWLMPTEARRLDPLEVELQILWTILWVLGTDSGLLSHLSSLYFHYF